MRQHQGQGQALRPLHRPPRQRTQGLRDAEAGPGDQLRPGRPRNHGSHQDETDLARPPRHGEGRHATTCTRASRTRRCWSRRSRSAGRNNNGHITTRHKGGGHKHHYRVVDFVRNKDGIPAKVERIEYDPNRTRPHRAGAATPTASAATSSPRAAWKSARTLMTGAEAPIKRRQHAADPQHPGRLDDPLHRDAAGQGRADRAFGRRRRRRCWRAKAPTRRSACARAKCAACTSSAAPRSAKSATKSTACARSARPARSAGAASARRCAASR